MFTIKWKLLKIRIKKFNFSQFFDTLACLAATLDARRSRLFDPISSLSVARDEMGPKKSRKPPRKIMFSRESNLVLFILSKFWAFEEGFKIQKRLANIRSIRNWFGKSTKTDFKASKQHVCYPVWRVPMKEGNFSSQNHPKLNKMTGLQVLNLLRME